MFSGRGVILVDDRRMYHNFLEQIYQKEKCMIQESHQILNPIRQPMSPMLRGLDSHITIQFPMA